MNEMTNSNSIGSRAGAWFGWVASTDIETVLKHRPSAFAFMLAPYLIIVLLELIAALGGHGYVIVSSIVFAPIFTILYFVLLKGRKEISLGRPLLYLVCAHYGVMFLVPIVLNEYYFIFTTFVLTAPIFYPLYFVLLKASKKSLLGFLPAAFFTLWVLIEGYLNILFNYELKNFNDAVIYLPFMSLAILVATICFISIKFLLKSKDYSLKVICIPFLILAALPGVGVIGSVFLELLTYLFKLLS